MGSQPHLLAPLQGAGVIPFVFRWYRPPVRAQPPANGFEPSGFMSNRCFEGVALISDNVC